MGCNNIYTIIEKENIGKFIVEEIDEENKNYINISGHIMWSSYFFDKIKTKELGSEMNILLYGAIIKMDKNRSGTFNIKIPINKNVNIIYFGKNKHKIWERN
jgi:hypothetical protein